MYGYYMLSSLGVKWVQVVKPYITRSQMTQFCLMMVQASYNIVLALTRKDSSEEVYPLTLSSLLWVYMVTMLGLFYNFYTKDRQRARLTKEQKKE
jgi:elongation of very long chain fatty acids protein 4